MPDLLPSAPSKPSTLRFGALFPKFRPNLAGMRQTTMTIHHISCGTMCPIGALAINGEGGVLEPAKLICHCLLIETSIGLVLVDTGLGVQDMVNPTERLGKLPSSFFRIEQDVTRTALNQVQALGFRPTDVTDIILTHLDFDNAGGLPDFPWARIHVLDRELEVATRPLSIVEKNRYAQAQFAHGPNWVSHTLGRGEKWFGFERIYPILGLEPELLLVPLFGHTRGHCGVAVRQESGWLLHCGDAIFHHQELDPVEPSAPLGITLLEHIMKDDYDAVESNQSLLRELYHESRDEIEFICTHDSQMFERIPAIPESEAAYLS